MLISQSTIESAVTPLVGVVHHQSHQRSLHSTPPLHLPLSISSTEDERVWEVFRYLNTARSSHTVARLITVPFWPRAERSAGGRWSVCFVSMGVDVMSPPLRNLKCFSPVMCQCKLICSNRTLSLMFGCKVSRERARARFCSVFLWIYSRMLEKGRPCWWQNSHKRSPKLWKPRFVKIIMNEKSNVCVCSRAPGIRDILYISERGFALPHAVLQHSKEACCVVGVHVKPPVSLQMHTCEKHRKVTVSLIHYTIQNWTNHARLCERAEKSNTKSYCTFTHTGQKKKKKNHSTHDAPIAGHVVTQYRGRWMKWNIT